MTYPPPAPSLPASSEPPVVWLALDAAGTTAIVGAAPSDAPVPPGVNPVRPGELFQAIPYDVWLRLSGRLVDVLRVKQKWRDPGPESMGEPPSGVTPMVEFTFVWDDAEDWRAEPRLIMDSLPDSGHGFCGGGWCVPCSRDQLMEICTENSAIPRVWAAGTSGLVFPEQVPFLVEACRERWVHGIRRELVRTALWLAGSLAALLVLLPGTWQQSLLVLVPVLLAVKLVVGAHVLHEVWTGGAGIFAAARQQMRYTHWLESRPRVLTRGLVGVLAAVMLVQLFVGGSVLMAGESTLAAAGLDPARVWAGEWWRMLTGPLLHGSVFHIWMNGTALLAVGPMVETHARRGSLPLVFLLSALGGSALSVLLPPDVTSVGASGGVMGLIGFLVVMGMRERERLPPEFGRQMWVSIAATAALGLLAFAVIDNAAHLGGLLSGLLLGWRIRSGESDRRGGAAGWLAAGVIVSAAGLAVARTLAGG